MAAPMTSVLNGLPSRIARAIGSLVVAASEQSHEPRLESQLAAASWRMRRRTG
jgi:hypothetical protein